MRLKKIMAFVFAFMITTSSYAMSVYAATGIENFHVYINGGSVVSSSSVRKTNTYKYMRTGVMKRSGTTVNWLSSETVNLRGRTDSGAKCTVLGTQNTPGNSDLNYTSGYGHRGDYYKLAVQYSNSNPYTNLDLRASWTP